MLCRPLRQCRCPFGHRRKGRRKGGLHTRKWNETADSNRHLCLRVASPSGTRPCLTGPKARCLLHQSRIGDCHRKTGKTDGRGSVLYCPLVFSAHTHHRRRFRRLTLEAGPWHRLIDLHYHQRFWRPPCCCYTKPAYMEAAEAAPLRKGGETMRLTQIHAPILP